VEHGLEDDEEMAFLVGKYRIIQRSGRHKYSTDDIVTSYIACTVVKRLLYGHGYTHMDTHVDAHVDGGFDEAEAEQADQLCILDMGCGLGSVLLSNAWQLPHSKCVGIEAQHDRYILAQRSVAMNLGTEQERVSVYKCDIRDAIKAQEEDTSISDTKSVLKEQKMRQHDAVTTFNDNNSDGDDQEADPAILKRLSQGFHLITGTPPYFPAGQRGQPQCRESAGCLFEMRGGVEEYCHLAGLLLRRADHISSRRRGALFNSPEQGDSGNNVSSREHRTTDVNDGKGEAVGHDTDCTHQSTKSSSVPTCIHGTKGMSQHTQRKLPRVFVICNTALASDRVYAACDAQALAVVARVDVIPVETKPALFCVFVIIPKEDLSLWMSLWWGDNRDGNLCRVIADISEEQGSLLHLSPLSPTSQDTTPSLATLSQEPQSLDPSMNASTNPSLLKPPLPQVPPHKGRVLGSTQEELVETLCVRQACGSHTKEYAAMLDKLGKPSSLSV
jgi:tRNA1(Val) A37 N6-methylase TrmN6